MCGHVHTHEHQCVHIKHTNTHVGVLRAHTCTHEDIRAHTQTHVNMLGRLRTRTFVCTWAHMYTQAHTHGYAWACACTHTHGSCRVEVEHHHLQAWKLQGLWLKPQGIPLPSAGNAGPGLTPHCTESGPWAPAGRCSSWHLHTSVLHPELHGTEHGQAFPNTELTSCHVLHCVASFVQVSLTNSGLQEL